MNKVVSLVTAPFRWVLNRIHLFLFVAYLNNVNNVIGNLLVYVLPRNYYDTITVEFHVPKLWLKRIFKEVRYKSAIYMETNHENLIKSPKIPIYPAAMRIPSEEGEELNTFMPSSSLYGNLITINDVVVEHTVKRTPYGLSHELIENYSSEIANEIDKQIFSRYEPSSFKKDVMVSSIFYNKHVIGRESIDNHTIGGYVPTKIGSFQSGEATADDIKEVLFHMPQGYRPRSKWYTNKDIGLEISTMRDGNKEYSIHQRDDSLQRKGVPGLLLHKPIVYNDMMNTQRAGDVIMMIADLTKAYTIVDPISAILSFNTSSAPSSIYEKNKYLLIFKMGGDVVHPEAIKVLKTESVKAQKEVSVPNNSGENKSEI